MTPEHQARQQIDAKLIAAGWIIQDYKAFNPFAGRGIALREVPLKSGRCDYLLLVDRQALGVVEAKKEGTTLSMVAEQSGHYSASLPDFIQAIAPGSLPFLYESTGVETFFRDERDPDPRSRSVFSFHRPETLTEWLTQPDTLRARLRDLPPLPTQGMRDCQVEGISDLEKSFAENQPRALIQMATGAGKTFTACAFNHERAVADGVNVGYEVYRIKTQVTEQGGKVEKGFYVDKRNKLDRSKRWEQLDEDLNYSAPELDRSVVVPSQIRTVLQAFKDALFTELFPGRTLVPKTLIFAKDDSHAEDIVHICREVFGKGNDFAKKITYKTYNPETKRYEKAETLIQEFRTSPQLRIAVTVDMIATGTDIKPLECLLFLRDVRSRVYFEQMKGRGTRVLTPTDLQAVSGEDARAKSTL